MHRVPKVKLTQLQQWGGCAAKLNPIDLGLLLNKIPNVTSDDLLVGFDSGDDACVFKQDQDRALIFTTDFISPIVDDPFDFGRIAAANAISDIYAMGGIPFLALNIVCYDENLGGEILERIMLGGSETCKLANVIIGGGHTVKSNELKYGLAVIGHVHPDRIIKNCNGKAGDVLIITKKLGTGVLSQALKANLLNDDESKMLTEELCALNDKISTIMQKCQITCATDITGFGLAGHLFKLISSSNCSAEIFLNKIPVLPLVTEFLKRKIYSSILLQNERYVKANLTGDFRHSPDTMVLFDPQTSGGMLICVPEITLEVVKKELSNLHLDFFEIGRLTSDPGHQIKVTNK